MRFFIPRAKDEIMAEEVYLAIKKHVENEMEWEVSEERIFRIKYTHNGIRALAQVGQPEPDINEPIFAILRSNAYLVCTPNRGVFKGLPLLIGNEEVQSVEHFEE